jgi:hypothetical protein
MIGKWLGQLGLTRLQRRPGHPKKDADVEEALKKLRQPGARRARRQHGKNADRNLVPGRGKGRQQGTHALGTSRFATTDGARQPPRLCLHLWTICPQHGVGAAILTPAANSEMMNLWLEEISTQVASGARAVLICDGAPQLEPESARVSIFKRIGHITASQLNSRQTLALDE